LASDSLILSDYFASELADARAARGAGHWVDVVEILESLVRSFGGIQGWGLSDAIRELDEIRGSEAYEHQRTHRDRLDIGGRTRIGRAAGLLDSLAEGGRSERLPSQVDLLRSLGLSPGAGTGPISAEAYDEALTERRVVEAVYVRAASVLPTRLLQRGDLRRAVLLLRMAVALAPDRPAVWYNLAAAQSRSGDRSQAIESLGRAIAFGFEDADRMRSDPDLAAVRSSPEFERLLQGIRKP
jgi:tetratricopeptide (TPR) repeat protein